MIHILDTHPLVWHLEGNPRLSKAACEVLISPASTLVIPSIVLAEISHLYHRKRIKTSPTDIRTRILGSGNCSVYPLDEAVLELLPVDMEIHDGIIVATALVYRDVLKQPVRLITRDRLIIESRKIDTLW